MVSPWICLRYSLFKISLPVHNAFFDPFRIKIKPMLWFCRLFLKMIMWFWFSWNLFLFFGILSWFTWLFLVFFFEQINIYDISIFIFSIHFILVSLIFFINQRLLRDPGLLNTMMDLHNLWIQSAFKRNCCITFFVFIMYRAEQLDYVYIV